MKARKDSLVTRQGQHKKSLPHSNGLINCNPSTAENNLPHSTQHQPNSIMSQPVNQIDYSVLLQRLKDAVAIMQDMQKHKIERKDAALSAIQIANAIISMAKGNKDTNYATTIEDWLATHIQHFPQYYDTQQDGNSGNDGIAPGTKHHFIGENSI
jgi:hypothetical protein